MSGTYIEKEKLKEQINEALDMFEGVFQITVDPSRLDRAGRVTIHLDGVPKKQSEEEDIF